jgi:excisionase family DNA binding protein
MTYLFSVDEKLTFYTSTEVAEMLRLHVQVVQRKLQAGEIPAYRIGKEWRVERAQLLEWLERHSNQRTRPLADRWFDREGRLKAMPSQRAKRRAVLERIGERFEPDRQYPEREVNALLRLVFYDVAYLRRELVAERILHRDRGVYHHGRG